MESLRKKDANRCEPSDALGHTTKTVFSKCLLHGSSTYAGECMGTYEVV